MNRSEEFEERLLKLLEASRPPIAVVEFDYLAFHDASSEEKIVIHRGRRNDYSDSLHFWVVSVRNLDWSGREAYLLSYLQSSQCRSMTEIEFNSIVVKYSTALKQPPTLPLHSESAFVAALQMHDDWSEVAALAEYEAEFIAFYWVTTA